MTTFLCVFNFACVIFEYSAFALLVLTLISLAASSFRNRVSVLQSLITWIFLFAAALVFSYYVWQLVDIGFSGNKYERYTFWHARAGGPHGWAFWLVFISSLAPQLLWLPRFQRQPIPLLVIAAASLAPRAVDACSFSERRDSQMQARTGWMPSANMHAFACRRKAARILEIFRLRYAPRRPAAASLRSR